MSRYFFHLHECGIVIDDEEGSELPDLAAVRERALGSARDVMAEEIKEGRLCLGCRIDVTDEQQTLVLRLPFKEAVAVTGL